ncbi:AzlC family ABC transporter permease [Fructilactobacillus sp. Tb1]|uniref:AzlC family ABC transporter permease n=1 Tax=Fructilactobacillus sp. Tb1 TaxID=3422304 RepID=UPI003D2D04B4
MKNTAFKLAFKLTFPFMISFIFLGITYGIFMHQLGINPLLSVLMAATIYGGSSEFIVGSLLLKSFNPLMIFILVLIINSRHFFYGISLLKLYKVSGWRKWILLFGLCDGSFVINFSTKVPAEVDQTQFMLYVTELSYLYRLVGTIMGIIIASFITINLNGMEFVMVSLFLIMFIDNFIGENQHTNSVLGLIIPLILLFIVGKQFFLPLSILAVTIIVIFQYRNEHAHDL